MSAIGFPFKQKPQLKTVSAASLLSMDLPERELIMSPWLPKQGLAMIYAPRGVGKTQVSVGIACAVATGQPFLGWEVDRPRGVLFIDGEMPAKALQERLSAYLDDCDSNVPLDIITPDLQPFGIPDLASEAGQSLIDRYVADDTELIIVDNLSTLVRSGKENEAESWLPVQNWALRHRSLGRTVLFIHHSGKSGQQRGTSRREDVLDTVIALKKPEDYKASQGARFDLYFEKARGIYGDEVIPFNAMLVSVEGRFEWQVSPLEESTYEKVISMSNQGIQQVEIARRLRVNPSTVSRYLERARSESRL